MRIYFVSSATCEQFELIRSCIDKVIAHAVKGEFTTDDLKQQILEGRGYATYVTDDSGDVKLACVWELVEYPRMKSVNVIALGGSDLKAVWNKFQPYVVFMWKQFGAEYVESYGSRAMVRLLQSVGFPCEPTYVFTRGKL